MKSTTSAQAPVSLSAAPPMTRLVTNEGVRWDLSRKLISGDHWYWVRLSFSQPPSNVRLRFNCGNSRPSFFTRLSPGLGGGYSTLVKFPYPCDQLWAETDPNSTIDLSSARVWPLSKVFTALMFGISAVTRALTSPLRSWTLLKRTLHWARTQGLTGFTYGLKCALHASGMPLKTTYQLWCENFSSLTSEQWKAQRAKAEAQVYKPLITVVIPTFRPDLVSFEKAVRSVRQQTYPFFQLCIVDDASNDPRLEAILDRLEQEDARIQIVSRRKNGHISAASNTGLEYAKGEWVIYLDHDDELAPDALYWVVNEVTAYPAAVLIYSDEDKIDDQGRRFAPHFKPEYDREMMYSFNLITHLAAFRTSFLKELNGFREGFEGSQDYDLFLRATEATSADKIRHLPRVLYHWRNLPNSTAHRISAKNYALDRSKKAIEEHFARTQVTAAVTNGFENYHAVKYPSPQPLPAIDLYIRGTGNESIESLIRLTDYPGVRVIPLPTEDSIPFTVDNGSPLVGIMREGLLPTRRDWLQEIVSRLQQPTVGVVGGKVLGPDQRVVSAGLVLDLLPQGQAAHAGINDAGYLGRAVIAQELSAVSLDCLFTRRSLFHELRGLDPVFAAEPLLAAADFCLRVKQLSYRTLYTPHATLVGPEPKCTPPVPELWELFSQRWKRFLNDPHYNPNLSRYSSAFMPAFPPRLSEFNFT